MSETSQAFADFADESYSWKFIERPALTRCIPGRLYTESARVLDIGSGSGRVVSYHVGRGVLAQNITGVEPDEDLVDIASRRTPGAQFARSRIQDFTLRPNSFDIVTAQLSLQYRDTDELADLFRKVSAALIPGGLFCTVNGRPARHQITEGFEDYFTEEWKETTTPYGSVEPYYYRTIQTHLNTMINAGLSVVRFDECRIAEGAREANSEEYANYSQSPARFAIAATVVVG
jgi:SAM-dependent methyltransferase